MIKIYNDSKKFIEEPILAINDSNIVLDIGCGIRPQPYINSETHICVEPYIEYVNVLNEKKLDNQIIINCDWESILQILPDNSVDTIFIIDVIEHLDKDYGKLLIKKTISKARKQVIIFTPLGFMPQHYEEIDKWGLHGGDWQVHKSGWTPDDFDENWDFYVHESYHEGYDIETDSKKMYGAFWGILTLDDSVDRLAKFKNIVSRSPIEISDTILNAINRGEVEGLTELAGFLDTYYANNRWGNIKAITEKIGPVLFDDINKYNNIMHSLDIASNYDGLIESLNFDIVYSIANKLNIGFLNDFLSTINNGDNESLNSLSLILKRNFANDRWGNFQKIANDFEFSDSEQNMLTILKSLKLKLSEDVLSKYLALINKGDDLSAYILISIIEEYYANEKWGIFTSFLSKIEKYWSDDNSMMNIMELLDSKNEYIPIFTNLNNRLNNLSDIQKRTMMDFINCEENELTYNLLSLWSKPKSYEDKLIFISNIEKVFKLSCNLTQKEIDNYLSNDIDIINLANKMSNLEIENRENYMSEICDTIDWIKGRNISYSEYLQFTKNTSKIPKLKSIIEKINTYESKEINDFFEIVGSEPNTRKFKFLKRMSDTYDKFSSLINRRQK